MNKISKYVVSTFRPGLYTNELNWVDWFASFHFSANLIELIRFLLLVSWLVTQSTRFHKIGDWVDCLWVTVIIESIELIQHLPKKVNKIEGFQKGQQNRRFSKKVNVLSNMNELIGILLYRSMVIESTYFHILSRLNWLICHESYESLISTNRSWWEYKTKNILLLYSDEDLLMRKKEEWRS